MANSWRRHLTHWGRDKMVSNFVTTFSNAFSWMKIYILRLRFHWSLLPRVQLTKFNHWSRWQNHYLNQWWLVYWCIYVSLGLNELNACCWMESSIFWIKFSWSLILVTPIDNKSALIQKMVKHHISHYLNQWWPKSITPYGITGHKELTKYYHTRLWFAKLMAWFAFDTKYNCNYKFCCRENEILQNNMQLHLNYSQVCSNNIQQILNIAISTNPKPQQAIQEAMLLWIVESQQDRRSNGNHSVQHIHQGCWVLP